MWRDAMLIARRDLTIELRSKVGLWQILPFGILALFLFAFALGPRTDLLAAAAPGLFWLAVLFSSILATQRSLNIEGSPATREANRLLGLDPAGVFLGKAAAMVIELLVLEVVLLVGIVLLFHVSVASWLYVGAALVLPEQEGGQSKLDHDEAGDRPGADQPEAGAGQQQQRAQAADQPPPAARRQAPMRHDRRLEQPGIVGWRVSARHVPI